MASVSIELKSLMEPNCIVMFVDPNTGKPQIYAGMLVSSQINQEWPTRETRATLDLILTRPVNLPSEIQTTWDEIRNAT